MGACQFLPSLISVDVDLGYTAAADKGTVTNTAGDDAVIPLANGTNAGLSLTLTTITAEKATSLLALRMAQKPTLALILVIPQQLIKALLPAQRALMLTFR